MKFSRGNNIALCASSSGACLIGLALRRWLANCSCWLFVLIVLLTSGAAHADDWVAADHISARVVNENGKFGIELKAEDGWHTYYKEPGDAGYPTTFDFKNSKDLTVKEVTYPPFKVIEEYGLKTNSYMGDVFFPVKAEFGAKPMVNVEITGAVCREICVPYDLKLEKTLQSSGARQNSYFVILLIALLAGFVMNFMPCVLPVLSLKILSVVKQSGVDLRRARFNFSATSVGILVSFWTLALFTIFLKSASMEIGWGLQFQSPVFVGIIFVITLLFGVSLLGAFHINPPSWLSGRGEHNSLIGNFLSGMLATLLGTSCTAPVLVTAVGFALSGSYFDIILIFTTMGIGMSAPFILLGLRPQLIKFLPKPGMWMVRVKQLMGILMLATTVWLGFLFYQLVQEPQKAEVVAGEKAWVEFDEAKIADYVANGKTVFVDVTATWCVNCKTNERLVTDTDEMKQFFLRPDLVLMRGDMTRPSKVLLAYIKKFGRYGIPFNIVYGPNAKDGILLNTLLSKNAVKQAVNKAAKN